MKKLIPIGLLLLIITVSGLYAQQTIVLKVKVTVANARSEPDPNSMVVKQIQQGTLVEAKSKLGSWYEIVVTDETGNVVSAYIHENVVEVVGAPEPPPPPQPTQPPQRPPADLTPARISYGPASRSGFKIIAGALSSKLKISEEPGFDPDQYMKSNIGIMIGAGYEMDMGNLAIEIDAIYMQKGAKFEGTFKDDDPFDPVDAAFEATSKIAEISFPILVKVRLMPGSTPYILGGAEVAYVTSSKIDYSVTDNIGNQSQSGSEDAKEGTEDLDYGIVFGAGYELATGPIPIMVEFRYHYGLADIMGTSEQAEQVESGDFVKTRAIVVMVGVKF